MTEKPQVFFIVLNICKQTSEHALVEETCSCMFSEPFSGPSSNNRRVVLDLCLFCFTTVIQPYGLCPYASLFLTGQTGLLSPGELSL